VRVAPRKAVLHVYSLRLFAVEQLRDEIRRLFEEYERSGALASASGWLPPVDVCESDSAFVVRIELPGIDLSTVSLTLQGAYLKIEGHKSTDDVEGTVSRLCLERSSGPFSRIVCLAPDVDPGKAYSSYRAGVLSVTIPKLHEHRTMEVRIPIELEGEQ